MAKRAVLIGINYKGTNAELQGCITDTRNIKAMLIAQLGFKDANITVLTDETPVKPTHANILQTLCNEVMYTQRHVVRELIITFSGHGSYVSDYNADEADGKDEVLCPLDYATAGYIRDDELHGILNRVQPETRVVWLADQCHSGTSLDLRYRYIGGKKFVTENANCQVKANVICLSGCRDDQYSSDAWGLNNAKEFSGAMTSSFLHSMAYLNYHVTCYALLGTMRDYLKEHNFQQLPQLTCNRQLNHCSIFAQKEEEVPFLTCSK